MINEVRSKPSYCHHRLETKVGGVSADPVIGSCPIRGAVNCAGWKTVEVLVKLDAGTIKVTPYEVAEYRTDAEGARVEEFSAIGLESAALASGARLTFTVNGARLFLRLSEVVTAAKVEVLIVGGEASLVGHGGRV